MAGTLTRGLQILEALAGGASGMSLSDIAEATSIPKSATHRVLAELGADGHVRQDPESGNYSLSLRFISLALRHLSGIRLVDLAKPLLVELAKESKALVRLSLVDGDDLVFVSRYQGATTGLRYDPDHGANVHLASSASGHAWLGQLPEEDAFRIIYRQGLGDVELHGSKCPTSAEELRTLFSQAAQRGYAEVEDSFEDGTSAIAAPIFNIDGDVIAVVSVAGPTSLLNAGRREELVPALKHVSDQLSSLKLSTMSQEGERL